MSVHSKVVLDKRPSARLELREVTFSDSIPALQSWLSFLVPPLGLFESTALLSLASPSTVSRSLLTNNSTQ